MPWTNIARREHKRETDRYPKDLCTIEDSLTRVKYVSFRRSH